MSKRIALALLPALLCLLCACTGPVAPTPSPAPTATAAPATATPAPAPTGEPTAAPTAEPTAEPEPTPAAPAVEADRSLSAGGKEYPACLFQGDLSDGGETAFSCVLPLEEVTSSYEHNAWVFRSITQPEALLELSFIAGGEVESLLPGFMDGYLDFTAIEFSEAAALGRMRGEVGRVTAENEALLADAWLMDVSGGTVAAVLLCPPSATEAATLLRAMLDTFRLE